MADRFATKFGSIAALSILFFVRSLDAKTPPSSTGIEGVVTIGPTHGGPLRVDEPSAKPYVHVTFDVLNDAGTVTSFTTDSSGQFRVTLAPGHYSIKLHDATTRFPRCGPFEVEVPLEEFKKVEWQCDSGIR